VTELFISLMRRPALSGLLLIIPTVIALFFVPNLKSDPSFDRLLVNDDPEKLVYEEVIDQFGDDNSILLYFEGPELFQRESLLKIRKFIWELEEIEEVQKVDSLFTTPHFLGVDGILSTTPVLEDIPADQDEIDRLIETAINNHLIATRLIAKDKSSLVVNLQIDSTKRPLKNISDQFNSMLSKLGLESKKNFQTGIPSIQLWTFNEMNLIQRTLLPLTVFVITLIIFLAGRSLHTSIIPIIVVPIGLIWTFAFMVLMDIPLQLLVSSVPIIIFILTTTEIVHIMTAFKENHANTSDKYEALEKALRETGLPITLTALTTIIGFSAICINKIVMLREFGIVSSFALFSCFIVTILYTPLHIRLFIKENKKAAPVVAKLSFFNKISILFKSLRKYKKTIVVCLIAYIAYNGYLAQFVTTDNDSINMIRSDSYPRENLATFEKHFGGINSVFLILDLKKGSFKDPENLKFLFELENSIKERKQFYDAQSFGSLMAHINNQMKVSIGEGEQYEIPSNKNLIAQYLLSLTRDDYEKFISADFKKANLTIRHSISSSAQQKKAIDGLREYLDKNLDKNIISYKITARSILNQRSGATIIAAQTKSILIMILIIFSIMSLLFKDFKMGLAAIPPNLLPILGLFGTMSLLDIPLNVGTCIVAAITVGISIDDTIHFFTRFKQHLDLNEDIEKAIDNTLDEETQPIVITSISLSVGFSFFLVSHMVPLNQFGILSAIVILLAMFADLLITPFTLGYMARHLTNKNSQT
jgi:predicted RND superfamily exporter protein